MASYDVSSNICQALPRPAAAAYSGASDAAAAAGAAAGKLATSRAAISAVA